MARMTVSVSLDGKGVAIFESELRQILAGLGVVGGNTNQKTMIDDRAKFHMATLKEQILEVLREHPGLTDRELTDKLRGRIAAQQPINQACRQLEKDGFLLRRSRHDDLIGNYRLSKQEVVTQIEKAENDPLSEDSLKKSLETWLSATGWETTIAWGRKPGVDIHATKGSKKWLIEVKGRGSLPAMRVNYFIAMLGESLQRMDDITAKYSIALPDLKQFRNLWTRLPSLAKQRTQITCLFVSDDGFVEEIT